MPLGLVRGLARIAATGRVIALPKRYRLPALALPGRRRFQQGGVTLATSVGDSEEFIGLREYRPGDPLQRVHWKSYARTGAPIVKEFQDEFFERHALVLDTSTERSADAAFEEAVAVAASFVYAIDTRECLLDLLFVGGEVRTYTGGRGQMKLEHMLEVLADRGLEDRPVELHGWRQTKHLAIRLARQAAGTHESPEALHAQRFIAVTSRQSSGPQGKLR